MGTNKKRYFPAIAAFLIPISVMMVIYILIGIYPFGDKSLLSIDMNGQYISFFSYLKSVLNGDESLSYSFSKTIGGNLFGFSSYYLFSPLNWIVAFFDKADLTQAIMVITLIKVGLSGLTMNVYLSKKASCSQSLIFSTAYALMTYNLVYQQNIMWLDGVYLLPLVMLGIDRLIYQKKCVLYIISLFLTISTNYYIGFMVCFFSVIYYFYSILIFEEYTIDLKRFARFSVSSLLAGGMSCGVVLPTLFSLANGKFGAISQETGKTVYSILELPSKFFQGSFNANEYSGQLPNIFCGCIVLILIAMYFFNCGVSKKEKVFTAVVFIFLFASTYLTLLSKIWHGFALPVWFPCRFSFIISFFMIIVANKGFTKTQTKKYFFKLSVFLVAFLALAFVSIKKSSSYISLKDIAISVVMTILIGTCFYMLKYKNTRLMSSLLIGLVCMDLGVNGYLLLKEINYKSQSAYSSFVKEKENIVDEIKNSDDSFYRMESIEYNYNRNDPMMFGYNGMSHYSSSENVSNTSFLESLGYHTHRKIWSYYDFGNTILADSLFGVKYVLSDEKFVNGFELKKTYDAVNLYENPYALSLGYVVNTEIENVVINKNAFEIQNDIIMNSTGINESVLTKENNFSIVTNNLSQIDSYSWKKEDESEEAFIEFEITVKSDDILYFYAPTKQLTQVGLYINSEFFCNYFSQEHHSIIPIGKFDIGDKVIIKMILNESTLLFDDVLFYYENTQALKVHYTELSKGQYEIKEQSSSRYIEGTVNSDKNGYLMFTVPYDTGWSIEIDGEKAEIKSVMDTLLMVEITQGQHEVRMTYTPSGVRFGIFISIFSLMIFVFLVIFLRFSNKPK